MAHVRLMIDPDTASDDAVATLLAARHPGTTITAVTTVAGNVPLAMAVALRPALVGETASVRVALGDEARGQLLIDRRRSAADAKLTLVRRVNTAGVEEMVLSAL